MPELPEVQTIVSGLTDLITGKKIRSIEVLNEKSFVSNLNQEKILNRSIVGINRYGKAIEIKFDSIYSLVIHLRMTGQLVYRSKKESFGGGHPTDSLIDDLPDKSTRVIFTFNDNSNLFFNDQRKFGWIKIFTKDDFKNDAFFRKLGPDPIKEDIDPKVFIENVRRHKKSQIKSVILKQYVIAGVGNIYADESLFYSKILPTKRVDSLTDDQLIILLNNIKKVMLFAIKKGGSTDKNYIDATGRRGAYLDFARVFRREGKKCFECGSTIKKIKVVGRGTHFCERCQK